MHAGIKSICRTRSPCIGLAAPRPSPRWCAGPGIAVARRRLASTNGTGTGPADENVDEAKNLAKSAENVPDYAAVDRVNTLTAETAHETKAAASPGTTYDKANPRSSDTTHKGQNREPVPKSHVNWERNTALRRAFLADTPEISRRTTEKLSSPFVPAPREYKSKSANRAMELKLLGRARAQVGFDAIAEHLSLRTPLLGSIFSTLQCISPEGSGQKTKISAIRIVMPAGYDLDAVNRNLTLIGSASGVSNRLRLTTDYRNSSTFVLRGLSSHIARAADELVAANKDVKVYKLGEVGAVDYETKQLWPVLEESTDTTMADDSGDKIWIHKEYSNYWISQPYEKIRKPEKWTRESLEEYKKAEELAAPVTTATEEQEDQEATEDKQVAPTSARKRNEKIQFPNLLPEEFLSSDDEEQEEGEDYADESRRPKRRKVSGIERSLARQNKGPADEAIGTTVYRVAKKTDDRMAPKVKQYSKSTKELLLKRNRVAAKPRGGFLAKR